MPTVRETGVLDFEMETLVGLFARAATPQPALARLRADFDKVMAQPEVAAMLEKRGATPGAHDACAKPRRWWRGTPRNGRKLIRHAGIRAD